MQQRTLFVFDIETVPDTDPVPNLTGFDDPDVSRRRAELERYHLEATQGKNPFPRQPFQRIVAISFLEAEIEREGENERYLLRELRSGGEPGADEKRLVQGFFGYFERLRQPRLVTFNGRGFDLPVLKYRAMLHGVPAPALHAAGDRWNSYTSRYAADWHCDLLDVLSDHGASARIALHEVAAVLGLPGKLGIEGSQIAALVDEGRIGEVRDYCETDVLTTYLVYLRWRLHTGQVTLEGHNRAVADAIAYIESCRGARPHLGRFLEAWGGASGNRFLL